MSLMLPWLGVGLTYVLFRLHPASFETLFLINIWLFSLPHTFSTFTRSDRRDRKKVALTVALLVSFYLGITAFTNVAGMVLLYSFYFYWQQFHYGKQNFGMSRWDGAQRGRVSQFFYLAIVFLCIAGLLSDGAQSFFGYALFNPLPMALPKIVFISAIALLTLGYLFYRPREWKHSLSHVCIFSFAYLYIEHFALGWLLLNVFHNLQYLKFMKGYEHGLRFLILPALLTGVLYVLQFHVVKGFIWFSLPMSLGLMLALNFTHYTLDGLIWRKIKHL